MQLPRCVRGIAIIMMCLAAGIGSPAAAPGATSTVPGLALNQAQETPAAEKVPAGMATVEVIVTDKYGKPVLDLKKDDFSILDNRIPQEIEYFSRRTPGIAAAGFGGSVVSTEVSPEARVNSAPIVPPVLYCLGYRPKDPGAAAESRGVAVKVNRPGLVVSFLEPAVGDGAGADQWQQLVELKLKAAAAEPAEIRDIPFSVTGFNPRGALIREQIRLSVWMDAAKIGFRDLGLVHSDRFHIAFFHQDAGGNFLFDSSGVVQLNFNEEEYQKVLKSGLTLSVSLPTEVQVSILKVVIYDEGSGKAGTKILKR